MRSRRERLGSDRFDIRLIEYGSPEWVRAWKCRARITGDDDFEAEEPDSREVWRYMGSVPVQGRWVHQFRHRCHPTTKERWYVNVPASPSWVPPAAAEPVAPSG